MNCKNCEKLKQVIDELKKRIADLEAKLARYENPHVPPSKIERRRPPSQNPGKPGQRAGHKGTTRPQPEPTERIESKLEKCPHCNHSLGEPTKTERRIIEEIPEPQPVRIIEFVNHHYWCDKCNRGIVASHPDIPEKGRFGKNVLTQVTLLKYEDRLPHRKIREALERQYGLKVSPASIFDFTRRVNESLQSVYNFILQRIRDSDVVYVDETGIGVNGKKYWIWIFVTPFETFVIIRKSRGKKVLIEVLARRFKGIIVCDGWRSYPNFTDRIQRCWAHLLRELKSVAEKVNEAIPLSNGIHRLFHKLTELMKEKPPSDIRKKIWYEARATMKRWLKKDYNHPSVNKLIAKIQNGFDHWFTFILHPKVEPTNNRAERALREHVVQRKIIGTLRNTKGTHIHEVIMSVFATWKQQGKNLYQTLRLSI